MKISEIIEFVREHYETNELIPLHAPVFGREEKELVLDTIDSTFVSSIGKYVDQFELEISNYTGANNAVAIVNGTAALHVGLTALGIKQDDLVITQALTFVATCNAIRQTGADPIFCDVSRATLGLSPKAVEEYLQTFADLNSNKCIHRKTGRHIKAVLVMHTFGHPVHLHEFQKLCAKWNLILVEDCAESLGSFYNGIHTGNFGEFGAFSFNGNKIITTGGGGIVSTNNQELSKRVKHLTTTAKVPHPYEFIHDEIGFNYRLPNLNAALGCAQLLKIEKIVTEKRELAQKYMKFFENTEFTFFKEQKFAHSNYWLNAVICENCEAKENLLSVTNAAGVMTRPAWKIMVDLNMYSQCYRDDLDTSIDMQNRLVCLPSSILGHKHNV
ncbi:LegC family aminotransferase [Planktomarina temperata]|nr:LegC family aminotransferase [Planktomarina temperata]